MQNACFGEFQLDGAGIESGLLQCTCDNTLQFLAVEMDGGDIDGHADGVCVLVLPAYRLPAGLLYHPFADRHNQAEFLGDRNEYLRRYGAQLRVTPSQQGFSTGYTT